MRTCYNLYEDYGIARECCNSCHEDDEDYDVPMCYVKVKNVEYHLCCKISEIAREKLGGGNG